MLLDAIATELGAHLLVAGNAPQRDIKTVFAGDRMSDLLASVGDHTLLVTHIANQGLLSLIELMEAPALCFLNNTYPEEALLSVARDANTQILVSPYGMYDTCGRLYMLLNQKNVA